MDGPILIAQIAGWKSVFGRIKTEMKAYKLKTIERENGIMLLNGEPVTDQEILRDYGRITIRRNDFVVKIDNRFCDDDDVLYSQSRYESKIYKTIHKADKPYFVKLAASGMVWDADRKVFRPWVSQEFLELSHTVRGLTEEKKEIQRIAMKYKLHKDVTGAYTHSGTSFNWAINKATNKPVIYDYGYPALV